MAITPLLRLGFRPFFLFGVVLAALAIPVWVVVWLGGASFPAPQGVWLAWHWHELVFGFAGAIISGCLLTAVQTWTGQASISGRPLAVLWLLGRLSWWLPSAEVLLALNVLFLLAVAVVLLNLAALVRVVGVSFAYQPALWMAALCWSLAFAQYLYCYGPMLCRTRVDGHPG